MNLICKTKNALILISKDVPVRTAFKDYCKSLTTGDKYALTLIACIVAISITLSYKREIDDSLTIAIEREAIASEQLASIYSEKQHIEQVLVSALNGAVIENGRKVTMCRLSAAGECK